MPRIFVPGPSVNTRFTSPSQILQGITDSRTARKKIESDKLFRDQTLAAATRRQDYVEAAPDRVRAEKLFERSQDNERAVETLNIIEGSGGSYKKPFLSNPETQALFAQAGIDDPAEQSRIIDELAKDKKSLFNDPSKLGDEVYRKALKAGKPLAEAQAAREQAVSGSFSTLPVELAKALIDKSGTPGGGFGKLFGGTSSTAGRPIQTAPAQKAEEELRDVITGRMNIEDSRGGGFVDTIANFFGIGDNTRSSFDFGQRDLDQGDIDRVVGNYGDRYPQHAIVGALRSIVNPDDGTVDQDKWQRILNDPKSDNAKAFETEIKNWQAKAERTRGGKILSGLSAKEIFNIGNQLQQAQDARNMNIIGRTSPQAADFASRLSALRDSQSLSGLINTPRQGGNQGGAVSIAPEVVLPPEIAPTPGIAPGAGSEGTGSAGLDSLLSTPPPRDRRPDTGTQIFPTAEPVSPLQKLADLARARNARVEKDETKKDDTERKLFKAAQKGGFKEKKAYADWVKANR